VTRRRSFGSDAEFTAAFLAVNGSQVFAAETLDDRALDEQPEEMLEEASWP